MLYSQDVDGYLQWVAERVTEWIAAFEAFEGHFERFDEAYERDLGKNAPEKFGGHWE